MLESLLERLLRGEHVNMDERISQGAWPHPPLKLHELVRRVADIIERENVFPRRWIPAEPGKPIFEGGVILREAPSRYIYRAQRAHPTNPTVLADSIETVFRSAEAAAAHYLKWDLALPGTLDGWEVVP